MSYKTEEIDLIVSYENVFNGHWDIRLCQWRRLLL